MRSLSLCASLTDLCVFLFFMKELNSEVPFSCRYSSRQVGRDDTLVSTFNLYKLSANKQKVNIPQST